MEKVLNSGGLSLTNVLSVNDLKKAKGSGAEGFPIAGLPDAAQLILSALPALTAKSEAAGIHPSVLIEQIDALSDATGEDVVSQTHLFYAPGVDREYLSVTVNDDGAGKILTSERISLPDDVSSVLSQLEKGDRLVSVDLRNPSEQPAEVLTKAGGVAALSLRDGNQDGRPDQLEKVIRYDNTPGGPTKLTLIYTLFNAEGRASGTPSSAVIRVNGASYSPEKIVAEWGSKLLRLIPADKALKSIPGDTIGGAIGKGLADQITDVHQSLTSKLLSGTSGSVTLLDSSVTQGLKDHHFNIVFFLNITRRTFGRLCARQSQNSGTNLLSF